MKIIDVNCRDFEAHGKTKTKQLLNFNTHTFKDIHAVVSLAAAR